MPTQQSDLHTLSLSNPEAFWSEAAKAVSWYRPPEKIFVTAEDGYHEKELGPAGYRWFAGSEVGIDSLFIMISLRMCDQLLIVHHYCACVCSFFFDCNRT